MRGEGLGLGCTVMASYMSGFAANPLFQGPLLEAPLTPSPRHPLTPSTSPLTPPHLDGATTWASPVRRTHCYWLVYPMVALPLSTSPPFAAAFCTHHRSQQGGCNHETLYICSGDGRLHSIDAATGEERLSGPSLICILYPTHDVSYRPTGTSSGGLLTPVREPTVPS